MYKFVKFSRRYSQASAGYKVQILVFIRRIFVQSMPCRYLGRVLGIFFLKKVSAPLFLAEKSLRPTFFLEKKSLVPLFFEKKSLRPYFFISSKNSLMQSHEKTNKQRLRPRVLSRFRGITRNYYRIFIPGFDKRLITCKNQL